MTTYIKESDVLRKMEDNSHVIDVFGTKRKMIDGMLLCYDIIDMEKIELEEHDKEIRNKVIDEFMEQATKIVYGANDRKRNPQPRDMVADIHYKLQKIAEQMKGV